MNTGSEQAMDLIGSFLEEHEIPSVRIDARTLAASLAGTAKDRIPVVLKVGETWLHAESFFMRAPMENHRDVYGLLLSRNMREPEVRFALDDIGDVYLVAQMPLAALTAESFDRLLGAVLLVSDEMFVAAVERGFASYIATDKTWRAKASTGSE